MAQGLFIALAGLFAGIAISNVYQLIYSAFGTLRIDHSNPDKDIYRLDVEELDKLGKKKFLHLKIDHHADLSQQKQ